MIISIYNIKCLVFITETKSVYCAVWTVSVNIFQFSFERFYQGRVKCGTEKMILASWTVHSRDIDGTCNISATGSSFLTQAVGWGPFFAGYERKPCTEFTALGVVWKQYGWLVTVGVQLASVRLVCRPTFVRHSSVWVSCCVQCSLPAPSYRKNSTLLRKYQVSGWDWILQPHESRLQTHAFRDNQQYRSLEFEREIRYKTSLFSFPTSCGKICPGVSEKRTAPEFQGA